MSDGEQELPGFFGKLPMLGDFVTRRLPSSVIGPLNDWLEAGIMDSRRMLGQGWLDAFLVSPAWHLALEAGICGPTGLCGVLVPSVDSVGRYYPLALLAPLPAGAPLLAWAEANGNWYRRAEAALMTALQDDLDAEGFDARVRAVGVPLDTLPAEMPGLPGRVAAMLGEAQLRPDSGPLGLGWTQAGGSSPTLIAFTAMPTGAAFTSMLNGRWEDTETAGLCVISLAGGPFAMPADTHR
ncbi:MULTISPECIES: type VI secretion system-associated protein TagF [unclassified Azospirillum]|uniref:type VI secretion system-associated protein TagF n=1 Tax=unclassified Azospirillum TaxID=2630922 RepID=UPI000B6F5B1C|nr:MULTISPECIES: type VI secretion system-associated protein TagF [unclassified Azospirillum]SNS92188.1 type VI secretion system protein ImpM [Azospirillum sp. RU38E]SNT09135.1 type VI secretion system protein ImpM [Azospirillum sp. RU37A]